MSKRGYVVNKRMGKKIRKARKQMGLTQEELAEKLKMHFTTVSRIETGYSNPPIQTVSKIAKILKVPLADLF